MNLSLPGFLLSCFYLLLLCLPSAEAAVGSLYRDVPDFLSGILQAFFLCAAFSSGVAPAGGHLCSHLRLSEPGCTLLPPARGRTHRAQAGWLLVSLLLVFHSSSREMCSCCNSTEGCCPLLLLAALLERSSSPGFEVPLDPLGWADAGGPYQ